MPSYEGLLLLKVMTKPETAAVLKRTATHIYKNKGLLFAIENLGTRRLPYNMSSHGRRHREGSYFLLRFDAPTLSLPTLVDEYKRDVDVIKHGIVKIKEPEAFECTLEEELKPPAYRKEVQEMIEKGRKRYKYEFQPKTGLDYNPFRR